MGSDVTLSVNKMRARYVIASQTESKTMADYIDRKLAWYASRVGFNPSGRPQTDPDEDFNNDIAEAMMVDPHGSAMKAAAVIMMFVLFGFVKYAFGIVAMFLFILPSPWLLFKIFEGVNALSGRYFHHNEPGTDMPWYYQLICMLICIAIIVMFPSTETD